MPEKISFKNVFQQIMRLDRPIRLVWENSRGWTLAQLGLIILQGVLPLAGLYLTKRIVDTVTRGIGSADLNLALRQALLWVGLAAGVALLSAIAYSLYEYVTGAQSMLVTSAVSDQLHTQSISVDLSYYEDPQYFDTLQRAQQEAPWRPSQIVWGLTQVVQYSISLAGVVALLIAFHWLYGLILLAAVLPGTLVKFWQAQQRFDLQQRHTEKDRWSWYFHWLLTDKNYAKELRQFQLGKYFRERYRDLLNELVKGKLDLSTRRVWAESGVQTISTITIYVTVGFAVFQALRGQITVGDLMMIYLGFQTGIGFLQTVLYGLAELYENNLFLTNFYQFMALQPAIQPPADPRRVPEPFRTSIRFENVSFTYPGCDQPALREVNLSLKPGEVIALVGENGSGKTTLVKLLCQLYRPTIGQITLDGFSQECFNPIDWMRQFSVIFQDYEKYYLTAWENIWMGDILQEPERSQIAMTAEGTGAHAILQRLPMGYDNPLGSYFNHGHELSIGEWQRVALARLFWRKAQVYILDEPASSLDPLAEAVLFERFRGLLNGRSAVLISHRFPTVQVADRIYVMEAGRIIEQGTHAELLRLDRQYAKLYRAQETPYRKAAVNQEPF